MSIEDTIYTLLSDQGYRLTQDQIADLACKVYGRYETSHGVERLQDAVRREVRAYILERE